MDSLTPARPPASPGPDRADSVLAADLALLPTLPPGYLGIELCMTRGSAEGADAPPYYTAYLSAIREEIARRGLTEADAIAAMEEHFAARRPATPTPAQPPASPAPEACPPWCDQLSGTGHTAHVRNIARFSAGPFEVQVWICQDSSDAPSIVVCVPEGDDETVAKLDAASAQALAVVLIAEDPGHPLGEALVKAARAALSARGEE